MKENEEKCKQELHDHITASVKREFDLSVYELIESLDAHSVFLIYQKHDVEMYYGSLMGEDVKATIADWIDNHHDLMRDNLPTPFPCSEDAADADEINLGYEELTDMYYCVEEFAETVQEFCDLYFKEYRR